MDNKNMGYRARLTVAEAMSDPKVGNFLHALHDDMPQVFVQSVDTAYLAVQIAEAYGWNGDAHELAKAALLHDVGMLHVPKGVLEKQGRLDEKERQAVMLHVTEGLEMLKAAGFTGTVLDVAGFHHERSNGTGYPFGLESPAIPRPAKIVMVCDVYEALTSDRPQRKAFNMYEAVSMMSSMPLSGALLQSIKRCDDA